MPLRYTQAYLNVFILIQLCCYMSIKNLYTGCNHFTRLDAGLVCSKTEMAKM